MSWQCTSWALREAPAPTSTARLVLIALADRCQPDGRSAWPNVAKLAEEAHTSESSVKRALKGLEECGAIRRGNQRLAQWDENGQWVPAAYRPVVWECCMHVTLEHVSEKPGRQARLEREQRRGATSAGTRPGGATASARPDRTAGAGNAGEREKAPRETGGVRMTPLETVGNKPNPSGVRMTPLFDDDPDDRGAAGEPSGVSPVTPPSRRTNTKQISPSVPYGDISPKGEPRTETTETETDVRPTGGDDPTPTPACPTPTPTAQPGPAPTARKPAPTQSAVPAAGPMPDVDPNGVCPYGLLAELRAARGLGSAEPRGDRDAWLELVARRGPAATRRMLERALVSPYWSKRIRSWTCLRRSWDQLADETRIDLSARAAGGVSGPSYNIPDDTDRLVDRLLDR
ncbi:hypothetical protein Uis1B_2246, partial [Bifidobacterium margollesii]